MSPYGRVARPRIHARVCGRVAGRGHRGGVWLCLCQWSVPIVGGRQLRLGLFRYRGSQCPICGHGNLAIISLRIDCGPRQQGEVLSVVGAVYVDRDEGDDDHVHGDGHSRKGWGDHRQAVAGEVSGAKPRAVCMLRHEPFAA